MGTYKVIQDIEAEDKLIGWMTPRQTIYAAIVVVSLFVGFLFASNGVWWLSLPMLPHIILFSLLAGPFVHDQPSEVWLLAKIKFALMPRKRIWDQSGIKELVTITVPKKIERRLTDGLSQNEVKSRLQALANTIDSRGWAVKNISNSPYGSPSYATASSERLLEPMALPQEVPNYASLPSDDVFDSANNMTAQHMQQMVTKSAQDRRQQLMSQMQQPVATPAAQPTGDWFTNQPAASSNPVQDDQQIMQQLKASKSAPDPTTHMRGVSPVGKTPVVAPQTPPPTATQPHITHEAVEQLARNNDLNISTIARQANKSDEPDDNEVVISLR